MKLFIILLIILAIIGCHRWVKMPEPNEVEHSVRYCPRTGDIQIWDGAANMGREK